MKKKKVTLPINMLPVFEELAISKVKAMGLTDEDEIEKVLKETIQAMGEDAYLHSFTPSGELGTNPVTPKISQNFYKSFPNIFGKSGWFYKMLSDKPENVIELKIRLFKSSLVNLAQLYLELGAGLKTKGKRSGEFTDFSYPVKIDKHNTEEEFAKLVRVEKNRYIRLFITTILLESIFKVMNMSALKIQKDIESNDLWNLNNAKNNQEAFKILNSPDNRKKFIDNIKKLFKINIE